jgi:hypothetical protein
MLCPAIGHRKSTGLLENPVGRIYDGVMFGGSSSQANQLLPDGAANGE